MAFIVLLLYISDIINSVNVFLIIGMIICFAPILFYVASEGQTFSANLVKKCMVCEVICACILTLLPSRMTIYSYIGANTIESAYTEIRNTEVGTKIQKVIEAKLDEMLTENNKK